jgi:hypothetical protein
MAAGFTERDFPLSRLREAPPQTRHSHFETASVGI